MTSPIPAAFIKALAASDRWLNCGLEREGLRASATGMLSTSPHPRELGAKLTHPQITTDFGEAQLELITEPHQNTATALAELEQLHAWVWSKLEKNGELFWPYSMPCGLPELDEDIAIAYYGKSNAASLKHIYRLGLSYRYGRAMQTVSGVHLNLSLSSKLFALIAHNENTTDTQSFRNRRYFALMRNYRRLSYLINYLLGASAVIDASLARLSRTIQLKDFVPLGPPLGKGKDSQPLLGTGATTLRQSDIGYVAPQQRGMSLCFNELDSYIDGVNTRIATPYADFARIGIRDPQGNYRQLGDGLLQIENEYYTSIRPKQPTRKGQRPLAALAEKGVEYLELRNLDLNPFAPCGIDQTTLDFMALVFLWCAGKPCEEFSPQDCAQIEHNELISATSARAPGTCILWGNQRLPIIEAVTRALDELQLFADTLHELGHGQYAKAARWFRQATPLSQRVEDACKERSYRSFCLDQAQKHRASLQPPSDTWQQRFSNQTTRSWKDLAQIEAEHAARSQNFADFFSGYMQGKF